MAPSASSASGGCAILIAGFLLVSSPFSPFSFVKSQKSTTTLRALADNRGNLCQLWLLGTCLFFLFTSFRGHVEHAEMDTDLLKKIIGRNAARENPDVVVGDLLRLAFYLKDDTFRLDLHGRGLEQHLDLLLANALLDSLGIPLLDAVEGCLPVRESDLVALLVGQAHGHFYGTIAAAHHQDLFVCVVVGLDQAVHDLRQFLAFDSEFAGCSTPAQRQHDCMRTVLILDCRHC